jgi:exfoliative toxin A/B
LHALHLCIFTYRFVVKGVKIDTFLPTWFVTYMGFMVSVVSGMGMGMRPLLEGIMIYGYIVFPIILIGMLVRLAKKPLPGILKPTGAIFLAPSSLFFISYLNLNPQSHQAFIFVAYAIVFVTIVRVGTLLPAYLRAPFQPVMASVTFPTAIALVATFRMVGYLNSIGMVQVAVWLRHFFGIQFYITTAIIAYVAFKFLLMFLDSRRPSKKTESGNYEAAKLD